MSDDALRGWVSDEWLHRSDDGGGGGGQIKS